MSTLTFTTRTGEAIASVFDELAQLRIAVFHDYPYLYEGTVDYEKEYLKTYSQSERSFLFSVYDGATLVGATTAIPLSDETDDLRKPVEQAGFEVDSLFYFGESILLPAYRGRGLGHRFFDEREAHVRRFGTFAATCFCAVERAANHPARPSDYRPNDEFWLKRGYIRQDSLRSTLDWPDIGESVSTPKEMVYWMKDL